MYNAIVAYVVPVCVRAPGKAGACGKLQHAAWLYVYHDAAWPIALA